jgi:hypothetical protein
MGGIQRECGQTYGHVFRALRVRGTVTHPFSGTDHHGLTGANLQQAVFVLHLQRTFQNQGDFFEIGTLAGLDPPSGRAHMGDADVVVA